jgi:hypothetical protein
MHHDGPAWLQWHGHNFVMDVTVEVRGGGHTEMKGGGNE